MRSNAVTVPGTSLSMVKLEDVTRAATRAESYSPAMTLALSRNSMGVYWGAKAASGRPQRSAPKPRFAAPGGREGGV